MGSSVLTPTCLESTWGWPSTNPGSRESPGRTSHETSLLHITKLQMKTLFCDLQMANSRFRRLLGRISLLVTKTRIVHRTMWTIMVLVTGNPSRPDDCDRKINIIWRVVQEAMERKESRRGFSTSASAVIPSSQKPIHVSLSHSQTIVSFPSTPAAAVHG